MSRLPLTTISSQIGYFYQKLLPNHSISEIFDSRAKDFSDAKHQIRFIMKVVYGLTYDEMGAVDEILAGKRFHHSTYHNSVKRFMKMKMDAGTAKYNRYSENIREAESLRLGALEVTEDKKDVVEPAPDQTVFDRFVGLVKSTVNWIGG